MRLTLHYCSNICRESQWHWLYSRICTIFSFNLDNVTPKFFHYPLIRLEFGSHGMINERKYIQYSMAHLNWTKTPKICSLPITVIQYFPNQNMRRQLKNLQVNEMNTTAFIEYFPFLKNWGIHFHLWTWTNCTRYAITNPVKIYWNHSFSVCPRDKKDACVINILEEGVLKT